MTLLPFTLDGANDPDGPRSFPTGRPALLCFVKEDCPTSGLSMPLLQIAHEAFGNDVDVWAVGQEAAGNAVLVERHGLDAPMLDDSALKVSFGYDVHTVPTVILADATGEARQRFVGFGRDDWQQLYQQLSELTGDPLPDVDWEALPESRPGCGSRSLEPGIYERLAAEAEGSPLRARLVDVPSSVDEQEFVFDQGLTDGLPVVMPTPERVMRLLDGSNRDAQEVVAVVPPNMAEATIEKIAINAVMAGCRPEYLPVVVAAVEAACTDEFNAHGVMATTMGANPCVIVNGSIRDRIGMNMGLGVFGQGNRANASIGRALMLTLRNLGGARPGGTERSTFGSASKYTMAFAEWEERSPWQPLHVERGFAADQSVVTLVGMRSGPQVVPDQTSRTGSDLAASIARGLSIVVGGVDVLLAVSPEHADTFARDRYTKADLRARIQEVTDQGFADPELIRIVVAGGGAGKWSAFFTGWSTGPKGSIMTSRLIEEV